MTARALSAVALWGLAAHQLVWHWWLAPMAPGATGLLLALLTLLPLVPVLALWWRQPRQGLLWGATVGLGYFAHGAMEAYADPGLRWLALGECGWVLLQILALGAATQAERKRNL